MWVGSHLEQLPIWDLHPGSSQWCVLQSGREPVSEEAELRAFLLQWLGEEIYVSSQRQEGPSVVGLYAAGNICPKRSIGTCRPEFNEFDHSSLGPGTWRVTWAWVVGTNFLNGGEGSTE